MQRSMLLAGWCLALIGASAAQPAPDVRPIRLAVFDLEIEDQTPASALLGEHRSSAESLRAASAAARGELAASGLFRVIDGSPVGSSQAPTGGLLACDGCEARIAAGLGADQAMIGAVRRVTQTDYYVWLQIRDVRSGKVLDQQAANFAGGEEGWASGVRMLIRHQVVPAAATAVPAGSTVPAAECRVAEVSPVSGFAVCVDPPGAPVAPARREDL